VGKFGRSEQATNGSIIRHMRCAWWVPKAWNTHSEQYCFTMATRNMRMHPTC
jgi:hypothetical protein